jgi:hypothetical protein
MKLNKLYYYCILHYLLYWYLTHQNLILIIYIFLCSCQSTLLRRNISLATRSLRVTRLSYHTHLSDVNNYFKIFLTFFHFFSTFFHFSQTLGAGLVYFDSFYILWLKNTQIYIPKKFNFYNIFFKKSNNFNLF